MQNGLKQYGARATGSLSGRFHHARVRLTLIYVAILAAILFVSSYTIYSTFSNRLQQRFRHVPAAAVIRGLPLDRMAPVIPSQDQVQTDLVYSLFLVNGILLVAAAFLSYGLAGITLEPIQEAYERQRKFLSNASHELRTPLAILQTDLENTLEGPETDKEARKQAESHLEEVGRMGKLVDDLLTLSRLDENDPCRYDTKAYDLVSIVKDEVDRLQPLAERESVTLQFLPGDIRAVRVELNKELFQQALTNIIKNAILYNKKGGTVKVTLHHEAKHEVVKISDTGVGMSKEEVAQVFQRFYRVDKSRSRQTGGSGLGLSIASSAMERLGGAITIESIPKEGTTVALFLPIS
jgi:signal transduction histidine kinase